MQPDHIVLKVLVKSDDLQSVQYTARFTIVCQQLEVTLAEGTLTCVTPLVKSHGKLVDECLYLRRAGDSCASLRRKMARCAYTLRSRLVTASRLHLRCRVLIHELRHVTVIKVRLLIPSIRLTLHSPVDRLSSSLCRDVMHIFISGEDASIDASLSAVLLDLLR